MNLSIEFGQYQPTGHKRAYPLGPVCSDSKSCNGPHNFIGLASEQYSEAFIDDRYPHSCIGTLSHSEVKKWAGQWFADHVHYQLY